MTYKIVIVDDENRTRSLLKKMISKIDLNLEVVGEADNVEAAKKVIQKHQPEIILLDIQMPDGSGFDLLEQPPNRKFEVVFVTAHQEFAIRAIKCAALDYILKPVEPEELNAALTSAIDVIQTKSDLSVRYETLINNLQSNNKRIVVRTNESLYVFDLENLMYCQSDRNYTYFFLADGRKIIASRTLKEYEDSLTAPDFIRCHRSHIINLNFLDRYDRAAGGSIIMKDNTEIPLSRSSKERFLEFLNKF